jgi:K+-sensing histidine kinase KdpD
MIERHQLLATISVELAGSLDEETVVRAICALPVRDLADWCVLHVRGDGNGEATAERREIATSIEGGGALADELRAAAVDPRRSLLREALATGRSLLIESLRPEDLQRDDSDAARLLSDSVEAATLLPAIGAVSLMVVALKARGRVGGALLLVSTRAGRRFGPAELSLAEELAQVAALALDNARLYRQAQEALAARNEVLNVIAHDLRSPINGMFLTLDFLAEKLLERGAADLVDPWVVGLAASTRSMNRIVGELQEITRLESGLVKVDPRRLNLAAVLSRAVDEARPQQPDVELQLQLAADLPAVSADETRLVQVLSCLIANLAKFRSDEASELIVAAVPLPGVVRVSVHDPRSPTDPEELAHLFDRFWQAGHLDRRGVALGLSIAKALVDLHGGRIWAESSATTGTALLFELPALEAGTESPVRR